MRITPLTRMVLLERKEQVLGMLIACSLAVTFFPPPNDIRQYWVGATRHTTEFGTPNGSAFNPNMYARFSIPPFSSCLVSFHEPDSFAGRLQSEPHVKTIQCDRWSA